MAIKSRKSIEIITWIIRLVAGSVFMFSGFAKAIDPYGTLYKVDAYLASMSLDIWPNLELVGVFALCAAEFLVGVFILTGCFRRSTAIIAAIIMAFMLPLTLWIAVSDPVDDCGCFGDALVISNWATFWKNVALTAAIAWLVVYNKKCHWLVTPALQWIAFVATSIFIVVIELFGYISQPLIDFRPYKQGEPIIDFENQATAEEPQFIFIYEKDGIRKEFRDTDVLPEESEGWEFVDRKELPHQQPKASTAENGKSLRIWDKTGEEDVTEEAIDEKGMELLVMMPNLKEVSPATTWKLNSLYEWSIKNNVFMAAVVSGTPDEIDEWEDLSMASYPIFTADDTQIKEVVRGNPAVVYLVDGKIEWKSSLAAINIDDFLSPGTSSDAMTFGTDNMRILRNCLYTYLTIMAVLVFLSFTPAMKNFYLRKNREKEEKEKRL
jgi:triose-phosphate isomerase